MVWQAGARAGEIDPMSYGAPPEPPTTLTQSRPRLGTAAIVIAVLAVTVVAGVIAGVVVLALRSDDAPGGPVDPPPPPPSSPSVEQSPDAPDSSAPPTGEVGPPVTAVQLPTSGDLVWPDASWQAGDTVGQALADPQAPCQTFAADGPPTRTAVHGRSFSLPNDRGRAFAYVMSFQGEADAITAQEQILADGMGCAGRLGGEQGEQHDLSTPLGSGSWTDLSWTDDSGEHAGAWGVARHGDRVIWLWMEAAGDGAWRGDAAEHPMPESLTRSLRRLMS